MTDKSEPKRKRAPGGGRKRLAIPTAQVWGRLPVPLCDQVKQKGGSEWVSKALTRALAEGW